MDADHAVLAKAAEYIARFGQHRGEYWPGATNGKPYRPGLPCCPLGAIAVVLNPQVPDKRGVTDTKPALLLRNHITNTEEVRAGRRSALVITLWADHRWRTTEQVIEAMRAAAGVTP